MVTPSVWWGWPLGGMPILWMYAPPIWAPSISRSLRLALMIFMSLALTSSMTVPLIMMFLRWLLRSVPFVNSEPSRLNSVASMRAVEWWTRICSMEGYFFLKLGKKPTGRRLSQWSEIHGFGLEGPKRFVAAKAVGRFVMAGLYGNPGNGLVRDDAGTVWCAVGAFE